MDSAKGDKRTEAEKTGHLLKRARLALGWTQGEAAKLADLDRRSISRIEYGTGASADRLLAYARALEAAGSPIRFGAAPAAHSQPTAAKPVPAMAPPDIDPRIELIREVQRAGADVLSVDLGAGWSALIPGTRRGGPWICDQGAFGPSPAVVRQSPESFTEAGFPVRIVVRVITRADVAGLHVPGVPLGGDPVIWHRPGVDYGQPLLAVF